VHQWCGRRVRLLLCPRRRQAVPRAGKCWPTPADGRRWRSRAHSMKPAFGKSITQRALISYAKSCEGRLPKEASDSDHDDSDHDEFAGHLIAHGH